MTDDDLVFVIGLLRGAVEGDPRQYFGSIRSWDRHQANAIQCGVVEVAEAVEEVDGRPMVVLSEVPTEYGKEFYVRHDLGGLPPGRAYMWPPERLSTAIAELAATEGCGKVM
ncbi:hypothetical protein [Kutzneria albida]|uniref:Uncharacterized protein n=1 Tax=Kutzneria albida DSM 43870 TaxID=1449976 RepID=W5WC00_9PSEU|nr:hypothetical protein [Kutzneria albida]AHH98280.1 hypothetical protein KALB_4918 [Kutzneria albida DSM 43870]